MDQKISEEKVAFVSNTLGTTPTEVFQVGAIPVLSCMLYALIKCKFRLSRTGRWNKDVILFALENIIIVFPSFLAVTLLSDYVFLLDIILLIFIAIVFYVHVKDKIAFSRFIQTMSRVNPIENTYVTNYKAVIHICSAICILAVDFNIYPRRFAKAEVYGVGIMDMAVGTIIFSNALTSSHARTISNDLISIHVVFRHIKTSLILAGCGVMRIIFVKGSNYQEHVTEYGVHWNFFFTLALIKPLASFILYILPWCQKQPVYLLLSLLIITCYETGLSNFGLTNIIQSGMKGDKSRTSFLDANREGLFSCIGYLSIYFFGLFTGKQIFKTKLTLANKAMWLFLWFLSSWILMNVSIYYISPISRQMANMSYFLIQIAWNSFLLVGCMTVDLVCYVLGKIDEKKNRMETKIFYFSLSVLSRAVNRNLLLYFLLCNIFTGFVNFSFDTINCTDFVAVVVNISYVLVLNLFIWLTFIFQL